MMLGEAVVFHLVPGHVLALYCDVAFGQFGLHDLDFRHKGFLGLKRHVFRLHCESVSFQ